jgi:flagellar L-ring protein precursor FlgH
MTHTTLRFATLILATAALGALAAGCATKPTRDPAYAAVRPQPSAPSPANPGSIYQPVQALSLFEDQRARRVGDTLTIRLVERTNASKKASTSTKKDSAVDIPNPTLLGVTPRWHYKDKDYTFETNIEANREFSGAGDSSQSNSLSGSITVTVAEVLGNGNLIVRGEKTLSLNQGHEFVRLAGIVRPVDIAPDNSVLSTQVGDAQISYGGQGVLDESNTKGWLARFFDGGWFPF